MRPLQKRGRVLKPQPTPAIIRKGLPSICKDGNSPLRRGRLPDAGSCRMRVEDRHSRAGLSSFNLSCRRAEPSPRKPRGPRHDEGDQCRGGAV